MKTVCLSLLFLSVTITASSQDAHDPSPFSVNAFLETYYVYDFNKPENSVRPAFIYSHNRHNEMNLNLGFVKVAYNADAVRANLGLMTGTYANANLAAEPGVLKNVYEANAGVKISRNKDLWIDAGIFSSHIGFESAHSPSCWTLTRSIVADNTPYYEAGAKITYTSDNGKWLLSGLVLNGWQRIQRVEGNSLPSFGTQIAFKPNSSVTLNSSTFIGTDKPDSARQMRYFHNFYGIFQVTEKMGLIVGFDYGVEEKNPEAHSMNPWLTPVIIARLVLNEKTAIAIRGEYYDDEKGVVIPTGTKNGFKTTGLSANFDYQITPNAVWRFEVRNLTSKDEIFVTDESLSRNNTFVTTSLAISF